MSSYITSLITSHFIHDRVSYPILFTIPIVKRYNINYISLHTCDTKFGAFREIVVSRATSGGRRKIEMNSGSLPPIPEGLATLIIPADCSDNMKNDQCKKLTNFIYNTNHLTSKNCTCFNIFSNT